MMTTGERSSARIAKVLSANDTGDTGGHQSGILVPKQDEILAFFPWLDRGVKNPRATLMFRDSSGKHWEFCFIYYNNKLFGGTRNEYRLTRMTAYIRSHRLRPGDRVVLNRSIDDCYSVGYERQDHSGRRDDGVLRLGTSWVTISIGARQP